MAFHLPEQFRLRSGKLATAPGESAGYFFVTRTGEPTLRVIACEDYDGWDHVSVSLPNRTPTWEEMCRIKNLFWDPDDCVMQLHPPRTNYVNCHPYCLHLWRPTHGVTIPQPPSWLVGPTDTVGAR